VIRGGLAPRDEASNERADSHYDSGSPSAAQRKRNVTVGSRNMERERAVGASLDANAVGNMRRILDQLGSSGVSEEDSLSIYDSNEGERNYSVIESKTALPARAAALDEGKANIRATDYEDRFRAAEREMQALNESLSAERRANDRLQSLLGNVMDLDPEDVPPPSVDDRESLETGADDSQQQSTPSYAATKTYASFMKETAQEVAVPDGEGE
jgi:hypothetical protein